MEAINPEVIVQLEQRISEQSVEVLFMAYRNLVQKKAGYPPHIDEFYYWFREAWIAYMHEELISHSEFYGVDPQEITPLNVEKYIEVFKLPTVPSYTKVHEALHHFGLSYISYRNQLVNDPTTEVW